MAFEGLSSRLQEITKKLKGESVALINERRKKVPIVYEQLKKLRNALNLKRKNTNLNQSSKTFELLSLW